MLLLHGSCQLKIMWQCWVGQHFQASSWADCCPATTMALETMWAESTECGVTIPAWPDYTFMLTIQEGRKNMVQRNNETGVERQLRRIIVMQD